MRMQRVTYYLLGHRWRALMLAFFITFVPVLGVAGILYAGFVTLRKGAYEGGMLALAATLPYVMPYALSQSLAVSTIVSPEEQLKAWLVMSAAVSSNILTWVFAVMLHRRATWSQVLQVAALMGVLVVSVIHLAYPNVADWWEPTLQQLSKVLNLGVNNPDGTQTTMIEHAGDFATGNAVAIVLFNTMMQLIAARWWLASVYSPGLLRRELHNIRLSNKAGILFIVSLGLFCYGNAVVLDIMPILCLLFGSAGLSLMHYMFAFLKSSTRLFWICLAYVTLIFTMPVGLYFLASMALFDVWFDVRKRLMKA